MLTRLFCDHFYLFFDAYLFCDFVALCCEFVSVMLAICILLLVFLFITMTDNVFLLMLFCLSVSLLLCLFAVTDFVSCFVRLSLSCFGQLLWEETSYL